MQLITSYVYTFDKAHPPVAHALPGELLKFQTKDCFTGRITSEAVLMSDFHYTADVYNPAAGPVYIEGAEPGDVLAVEIQDIQTGMQGVITCDTTCGPLCDTVQEKSKIIPIRDGRAFFNDISFPIEPMIGVIGVAPAGEGVIDGFPGTHGGNLDSKLHKKGSRVYLPVRVEGALLQIGDVHAAMGDGELSGTGIEIPAEVTVKVTLLKHRELNWPLTETEEGWYVNACHKEFPEALKLASLEMQRLIMRATGWSPEDAYLYMSVQCDVGLDQACVPCTVPMIVRIRCPKQAGFSLLQ